MLQTGNIKRVEKPWGHEIWFAQTEKYVGKILHINAGELLSLQYHERKDETVFVLFGIMRMTVVDDAGVDNEVTLTRGEAVRIAPGQVHRMIAITTVEVVEVSTPEVGDVVRLQDRYGRT